MHRTLCYKITAEHNRIPLLSFLKSQGFSRHILSSMKGDERALCVNGSRGFGGTLLFPGDEVVVHLRETEKEKEKIPPTPISLQILYEDEDILVVNKPSNMPIHPSMGNYENTLANAAAFYFSHQDEPFVFRCINRLDRDTTGALILAKNPLSGAILSQQMRNREIKRTYLAIVEGALPLMGTVDAPIARAEDSLITREVNLEKGESAVTHYERLDMRGGYSLAELHLETGRTHQIRVHMKYIGHPLPGDYLYNPVYDKIRRQPLHSYQLEFCHPVTKEPLLFTAPVPLDFQKAYLG